MNNDQMKSNRYLRWHQARQKLAAIHDHFAKGGKVVVGTYTQATVYDQRHGGLFRAARSGLFVRRGKGLDCIDYCGIRFL